mmetsp:Transcript_3256/g.7321  ORF Transcript_3256/g.7321 Transcript_3256/m.7321 type:complete len:327 (-) Transcript_3256:108-1088(-)
MASEKAWSIACFCNLLMLIIGIILTSCSFDTVGALEYALVYDSNWKAVERDEIYEETRSFVGLGRSFVTFPREFIPISFRSSTGTVDGRPADGPTIDSWSGDGQNINVDLSLQISLVKENIPKLYYVWGQYWKNIARIQILRTIKDTTATFPTNVFFENRALLASTMRRKVREMLEEDNFFKLEDLQLRSIILPEPFEEAILDKILKIQQQNTTRYNQEVVVLMEQKEVEQAVAEANASVTLSTASAEGDRMVRVQKAQALRELVQTYGEYYRLIKDELGLADDPTLSEDERRAAISFFIWSRMGKRHMATSARQMVGFETPMVSI